MVVPLTIGFLACILFFFRVIQVQTTVDQAIIDIGRAIAVESSVIDSEEALFLSAEALLLTALQDDPVIEGYVKNGVWGILLLESDFGGEEIVLRAKYQIKLPVSFFEVKEISLVSQNVFRKWTGNRGSTVEDDWVYITPNGTVYHTRVDCSSLELSVKKGTVDSITQLRGKDGQKYYPCTQCEERQVGTIYYTDYGTLYHGDLSCSALKRTIQKVSIRQVEGRRLCSYCRLMEN